MGVEFVLMFFSTVFCMLNLFLYCYYGKCTTDSYAAFADCSYQSNWMDLLIDLQKYFILMIAHAQMPLHYHGYGMVNLNLESFCKVSCGTELLLYCIV